MRNRNECEGDLRKKDKRSRRLIFFWIRIPEARKENKAKYVAISENDCAWTYLRHISKDDSKIIVSLS